MARLAERLSANVPGEFYVDSTCIDCAACRVIAPASFARDDRAGQSIVARQPAGENDRERAAMALVACPTASIGTLHKIDARAAARRFPEPVSGVDDVFYCGFHSPDSYGAFSWLVQRVDGNVLIDSPRANRGLLARLDELGGVSKMFLTHRDDVADHERFHARFGCARILHGHDAGRLHPEQLLEGDDPIALAPDLLAIPVPGHTRGSTALLFRDVLFTGDHLWADEHGRLEAEPSVCWWSWNAQLASLEKLAQYEFRHVLPGHGRPLTLSTAAEMRAELRSLVDRLAPDA
jgi:glyoxylase-like metal-dependent hydrolase (beta-lactamase superfamily II)/ferredoxin